jgi:hypothetical protein
VENLNAVADYLYAAAHNGNEGERSRTARGQGAFNESHLTSSPSGICEQPQPRQEFSSEVGGHLD